jgi:pSer/pThr/pTyr-binding forkhead associated (FHA) protein
MKLIMSGGKEYTITKAKTTIGRAVGNDVRLDDPGVSDFHVLLQIQGGDLIVNDLSATTGSFVNERKVSGSRPVSAGDTLRLGDTVMTFQAEMLATSPIPAGQKLPTVPPYAASPIPEVHVLIQCPRCGRPSDSIKQFRMGVLIFVIFAYFVRWNVEAGCPSCIRLATLRFTLINLLTANLVWPFLILPMSIFHLVRSFNKGHSPGIRYH